MEGAAVLNSPPPAAQQNHNRLPRDSEPRLTIPQPSHIKLDCGSGSSARHYFRPNQRWFGRVNSATTTKPERCDCTRCARCAPGEPQTPVPIIQNSTRVPGKKKRRVNTDEPLASWHMRQACNSATASTSHHLAHATVTWVASPSKGRRAR